MAKLLKVSDEIHNWVMENRCSKLGFTADQVIQTLKSNYESNEKTIRDLNSQIKKLQSK